MQRPPGGLPGPYPGILGSVQACTGIIVYGVSEQVGRQVSVYIRAEDLDLWRRAEAYARSRRVPMSGLVALALAEYLDRHDPPAKRAG